MLFATLGKVLAVLTVTGGGGLSAYYLTKSTPTRTAIKPTVLCNKPFELKVGGTVYSFNTRQEAERENREEHREKGTIEEIKHNLCTGK